MSPERDNEEGDNEEKVSLTIDHYAIKLSGRRGDLGEDPPKSWKEVFLQANRHLMRLVSGTTRVLAEAVEGLACLIRGSSRLPDAVRHRLEEGYRKADSRELARQEDTTKLLTEISQTEVERRLSELFAKYRAQGYIASIELGPDGKPLIVVGVRLEQSDALKEAARYTLEHGFPGSEGKEGSS